MNNVCKIIRNLILLVILLQLLSCSPEEYVQFGIISDVHQDIMHDGEERLGRFIEEMNTVQPDFIIQLGDFCRPYTYNEDFLDIYNDFQGSLYHVIGNHDMDGGFSRDSVVSFWASKGRYYSFDQYDFHFIVLDGNDFNPAPDKPSGYNKYIGADQVEWLKTDLESTENRCILFSHQALRGEFGIDNAQSIRQILEDANERAGSKKVIASFNGHNHADTVFQINGIYYIEINSSSYDWLGGDYTHQSYSKEVHDQYPYIQYTAPYDQPVWALVEIGSKGTILIKGKDSMWVGPDPKELGHPGRKDGIGFSSRIRDTMLIF
ncbi:MAG: metallophosphoesterase family protein [Bacteroidota bacterium]|nr:metallophosphoesterase family protein [Bacteroidota bacterium]